MGPFDIIENEIRKLDLQWFKAKKELFKKETFYDPAANIISDQWDETDEIWDERTKGIVMTKRNGGVRKTLNEYCWTSYYPGGIFDRAYAVSQPIDASEIAANILSELSDIVGEGREIERYKAVDNAAIFISNTLERLKHTTKNREYLSFLDFFHDKLRKTIKKKYAKLHRLYLATHSIVSSEPTVSRQVNKGSVSSIAYKYLGDGKDREIEEIFYLLKANGYLDEGTTLPTFRRAFVNKAVTKRINWTDGISTLSYFIKMLVKQGRISKDVHYWLIAENTFLCRGDFITTTQLKNAKSPALKKRANIDKCLAIVR